METDTTMAEMWRVKDELGARFAWNPRAICADLMAKQQQPHTDLPLVDDLTATLTRHAARIGKLPAALPTEAFMLDDPIIAEVRRNRQKLAEERADSHLILKEEPPRKKD
jgi:hypothetical protein